MLCSEETALLGEGQLPENVILLPNYDTVRNILSNYTLYSLDGVEQCCNSARKKC